MKTAICLVILAHVALTRASRFLFVFGDSYSFTGFNPNGTHPTSSSPLGNPAYPGDTSCGGANWVDLVTTQTAPNDTLTWNYAYAGATIDYAYAPTSSAGIETFDGQIGEWNSSVGTHPAYAAWTSANSAAISWFGMNDWGRADQSNFTADLNDWVGKLQSLYNAGVRRFVLTALPPMQRTPEYYGSRAMDRATRLVGVWNSDFQTAASQFNQSVFPNAHVAIYDPTSLFNFILDHPSAYGAPNNTCYNSDGVSCLWWNSYHPGQAIHKALAHDFGQQLQHVGFF